MCVGNCGTTPAATVPRTSAAWYVPRHFSMHWLQLCFDRTCPIIFRLLLKYATYSGVLLNISSDQKQGDHKVSDMKRVGSRRREARGRRPHTCQVSRISRETHAFSVNSRISARTNIFSRIFFCEVTHIFCTSVTLLVCRVLSVLRPRSCNVVRGKYNH